MELLNWKNGRRDARLENKPAQICNRFRAGLLTEKEAIDRLNTLQIRGVFNGPGLFFLGYDYNNQKWIEVDY